MPLQDTLRELVEARGVGVTSDAAELRGALDDFLAEEDATVGEVNLLVDAVRLGALSRLVELLDHGASPQAAVADAGATLARDRGSDDDRRSRWAVAVLGYALGRLDPAAIPTHSMDEGTAVPSGTIGSPEAVPTALQPESAPVPPPDPVPVTSPAHMSIPPPPPPPPVTAAPARRRTTGLTVLLVALVIGATAGVGIAVWKAQQDDGSGGGSSDGPSRDSRSSSGPRTAIPEQSILVPYRDDADALRIYEVNAETGRWKVLVDGTAEDLPTVSPDRTRFSYQDRTADGYPVLELVDLDPPSDATEPFPASGPCAHALRPGWSLDGERFAIVCTGADDLPDGVYLCQSDGSEAEQLIAATDLRGSPTWIDDHTFIYGRDDPTTGADTLWTYDVETRASEQLQLPDAPDAHLSHADWSAATGQLLFLVHDTDDTFGQIWVSGPDLSDAHPLGETQYAHPVWSPDGTHIAALWQDPEAENALRLVTIDVENPDDPVVLADLHEQPNGVPTIPVWASR